MNGRRNIFTYTSQFAVSSDIISAVSVLCFLCNVCIMIQCDETGQLAEVVMSVLCFMQLPTKISMN